MSGTEALDDRVRELANLRRQLELAKSVEEMREEDYMQTPQYHAFVEANNTRKKIADQVATADALVRSMAIAEYNETKEKKFPGVSVFTSESMTYDTALALEWCKERLPEALTIIPKTFEKVAEIMKPDFVKFTDEPKARIASDLSAFLEGE